MGEVNADLRIVCTKCVRVARVVSLSKWQRDLRGWTVAAVCGCGSRLGVINDLDRDITMQDIRSHDELTVEAAERQLSMAQDLVEQAQERLRLAKWVLY